MSQTAASTTSSMLDHAARWFSAKKPQPIKPTRRGVASTRSSSPRLWDFAGGAKRLAHSCAVEVGAAGPIEDYLLPPRHEIDRLRQRAHRSRWDDHRAVHVRVDDIVAANKHPENVRVAVHLHHVNMGVTRPDPAADDLEAWREHVDVSERPIGDAAGDAEASMHGRLHLTPERPESRTIVDVLDHGDRWQAVSSYVLIPVLARRDRAARRLLRADEPGAGKPHDRGEFPVDDDHWLDCEADRPTSRRHDLEPVADRRRIPSLQGPESPRGERRFAHGRSDPLAACLMPRRGSCAARGVRS